MQLSLDVPRALDAPAMARAVARERFAAELTVDELSDLELLVTELITNAVVHGRGAIRLRLNVDDAAIHGEVVDHGSGFERRMREQGADEAGGRGLELVGALAQRWGIHEGSSHVWFEIERRPTPPSPEAPELGVARKPPELTDS